MRTSDADETRGRRGRRIATLLATLAAIVAVDVALCLLLEPFGAHTELVWTEYRRTEQIDTIIVGSSTAAYNLDPAALDAGLGSTSFNLGTPGQSLDDHLSSLEQAAADHDLRRAILCVGYESLCTQPYMNASVVFTQSKCLGEPPAQVLADVWRLVSNDYYFDRHYSLSCAFPWAYDHVDVTWDNIAANVRNRLEGDVVEAGRRYTERIGANWQYVGQGYGGVHFEVSDQYALNQVFAAAHEPTFNEQSVATYRKICDFCRERGIDLYVMAVPYTPSALHDHAEHYVQNMREMRDIALDAGAHFFDFNLLHRDVFDPDQTWYCDQVHLSDIGAREAGTLFARLVADVEAGRDVSGLFFDYTDEGWDALWESIDFVDSVNLGWQQVEGGVELTATCITGPSTPVEYRYEVFDEASDSWVVTRDYDPDPTYLLAGQSGGTQVRVYAQATTGHQDRPRWLETTV